MPKTGHYVIHVHSRHESQVMIDGVMVIASKLAARDDFNQQAAINLTAGYHLVGVQFVHSWGQANIHLGWQPPVPQLDRHPAAEPVPRPAGRNKSSASAGDDAAMQVLPR